MAAHRRRLSLGLSRAVSWHVPALGGVMPLLQQDQKGTVRVWWTPEGSLGCRGTCRCCRPSWLHKPSGCGR